MKHTGLKNDYCNDQILQTVTEMRALNFRPFRSFKDFLRFDLN
jgi:hypothetical protein